MSTASRFALSLLASATCFSVAGGAAHASPADVPILWQAHMPEMRGDTTCEYGDYDCNVCVPNVREEFRVFKDTGRSLGTYWFRNDDHFAPFDTRGSEVSTDFIDATKHKRGHIQSFNRLPIDPDGGEMWFAATHSSNGSRGWLYLMSREPWYTTPGGTRFVYPLTVSNHPGSMQAIGNLLVIPHERADGAALYEVYDVSTPSALRQTGVQQLPSGGAANVGVAKLASGGYLMVSSRTSLDNDYKFFYVNDLETMSGFKSLGQTSGNAVWAEGLAMVTECGTGDLYVIGSGGDRIGPQDGTGAFARENLWTLYGVALENGAPRFTFTDWVEKDRNNGCNARAAASAYVDDEHHMHMFCHEKLIGDYQDQREAGLINYAEYWWRPSAKPGGAPGTPGGPSDKIVREN